MTNPRHELFKALKKLSDEVGEIPEMGSANARCQAVILVVNALFPKPKKLFATTESEQTGW